MDENQKAVPAPAIALSAAHSIALVARLLTVEEDCQELVRYLDGYAGILYAYLPVLPEESRKTIRALVAEILQGIDHIRQDLGLPRRQNEVTRLLAAHHSRMWVTLHETHGETLRGYGPVPAELTAYLDPRVDKLLSLVADLRTAIESGAKPAPADEGLIPEGNGNDGSE